MEKALLYIHGKGGHADEAEHYKPLFPHCHIAGLDYQGNTPWETKDEFVQAYRRLADQYGSVGVIANSIGAYFAMNALANMEMERAFFISPIVDMEKLITDMMRFSGVTEAALREKKTIETAFGETLSWEYLCYAREHPPVWKTPTNILYGENDNLTSFETISAFAERCHASLTVMKNGEHWFHTDEQIKFLDHWIRQCLR